MIDVYEQIFVSNGGFEHGVIEIANLSLVT